MYDPEMRPPAETERTLLHALREEEEDWLQLPRRVLEDLHMAAAAGYNTFLNRAEYSRQCGRHSEAEEMLDNKARALAAITVTRILLEETKE
jgi:hypothetical protein